MRQRQPEVTDARHLAAIRKCPCLTCGASPCGEAAHLRMRAPEYGKPSAGIGAKPGDRWALPLCHDCHMDQHTRGERVWWELRGYDPARIAVELYGYSPDLAAMSRYVLEVRATRTLAPGAV